MTHKNAIFKQFDEWIDRKCNSLSDVIDKMRCLDNLAAPVITDWYVADTGAEAPKPTISEMEKFKKYNLLQYNKEMGIKEGWIAAPLKLPEIAKYTELPFGDWEFEFSGPYDPDIYCNDELLAESVFMRRKFTACKYDEKNTPWIFMRIPKVQIDIINDIMGKSTLTGLKSYTDVIYDATHSLRAAAEILDTSNKRSSNYLSETLNVNKSKISDSERVEMVKEVLEAADLIDFATISEIDAFVEKIKTALNLLVKTKEYVNRFTLYFIGHSHMDLAWKWRWNESIECMKGTLENQLDLMDKNPEYVYVESSPVVWDALSKKYPEMWERCRKAAERGQLEPQGGMWCEPDCMCVGPESLMEQLSFGQRKAEELLGVTSTCGFNIDAFGFSYALPKVLREFGIQNFVTQKLRYNQFEVFPHILFWWESDDGSRVLSLHVCSGHSNVFINPDDIAPLVRYNHLTDGTYTIPVMWGYGNHGGGPQADMMDRVEALKKLTVFPKIEYAGFTKYFETIRNEIDLDKLPVIKNELFLETHHKTYTAQAKIKFANRELERRILDIQALSAVADAYDDNDFEKAWQIELFNQFHDVLSGTSIPSVYYDALKEVDKAYSTLDAVKEKNAEKLFGKGNKNYVFNTLTWRRNAIVELPSDDFEKIGSLKDSKGNIISYQRTYEGDKIVFSAELPALGFETFDALDEKTCTTLKTTDNSVSNKYMYIEFDTERGCINKINGNGVSFENASIGHLKILEDSTTSDYATWNMGLTGREFEPKCISFEKIEEGPVRVVFKAKYIYSNQEDKRRYFNNLVLWHTPAADYPTSFFEQYFIVYADSKRIDCVLKVDWWENNKILKVAAETDMSETKATYSIPFGTLDRPTKRETKYEKARYEVPALYYGELTDGDKGITIFNRAKHGYDALKGNIRLTLLSSPYDGDIAQVPDPLADRGENTIEYSFMVHKADMTEVELQVQAMEYERSVVYLNGDKCNCVGEDMLSVNDETMIITSVKGYPGGFILRGYDTKTGKIKEIKQQRTDKIFNEKIN